MKAGRFSPWDGSEIYSTTLGCEKFPLFKFCFQYIIYQEWNKDQVPDAIKAYENMKLYDSRKSKNDNDLKVLFNYHIFYENEVREAVTSISKRLKKPNDISFYEYGSIAVHLIMLEHELDIDIESAKSYLIKNLEGKGHNLKIEDIFRITPLCENEYILKEYAELRQKMVSALQKGYPVIPNFNYLPEQSTLFYNYIQENRKFFLSAGQFAKYLDITNLAHMFSVGSPRQKDLIRSAFCSVYETGQNHQLVINDFFQLKN